MEVMKQLRQRAIRDLVAQRPIRTQQELAAALRERGFRATQATISRDVAELELVKVHRDGRRRLRAAAAPGGGRSDRRGAAAQLLRDLPVEIREAGLLLVVVTLPGPRTPSRPRSTGRAGRRWSARSPATTRSSSRAPTGARCAACGSGSSGWRPGRGAMSERRAAERPGGPRARSTCCRSIAGPRGGTGPRRLGTSRRGTPPTGSCTARTAPSRWSRPRTGTIGRIRERSWSWSLTSRQSARRGATTTRSAATRTSTGASERAGVRSVRAAPARTRRELHGHRRGVDRRTWRGRSSLTPCAGGGYHPHPTGLRARPLRGSRPGFFRIATPHAGWVDPPVARGSSPP